MPNKKYHFLDNHSEIVAELKVKSMAQLAQELSDKYNVPKRTLQACLRWILHRHLKDHLPDIKSERKFHKNTTKKVVYNTNTVSSESEN